MTPSTLLRGRIGRGLCALLLGAAAAAAGAAPRDPATAENAAARAEQRRHTLDNGESPERLRANALARCNVHRDEGDRSACEARVRGAGSTSGSVAEGGILRETVTRVPGDEPGATPTSPR